MFTKQAIDAAVKALKQGSVSNGDVARGKEQLKAAVLYELDTDSGLISDIGAQALLLGANVQSSAQIVGAIDSITASDVNAVSIIVHFQITIFHLLIFNTGCQKGCIWKMVNWCCWKFSYCSIC